MERVKEIEKLGSNDEYVFDRYQEVLDGVRPHMVAAGLILFPSSKEAVSSETYETATGSVVNLVRVTTNYKLAHVSGEAVDVCQIAEACDSGDQAIAIARTMALKATLKEIFLLIGREPEQGDPESVRKVKGFAGMLLSRIQAEALPQRKLELLKIAQTARDDGRMTSEEYEELKHAAQQV